MDGKTKLFGIIGNPVTHSFSPAMHTAAFQAVGINAVYLPFQISESFLPDCILSFRELHVLGFNVTVPYKEAVMPFLDVISEEARLIGAVNTVVYNGNQWIGYNTDGLGFVQSLKEKTGSIQGNQVTLLGAGGSARSIAYSLLKENVDRLTIWNRTQEKAEQLIEELQNLFPDADIRYINNLESESTGILINTTSVGMDGKSSPLDSSVSLQACKLTADIIYNPSRTPLLRSAEKAGIPVLNGIGMLLYQGTAAFEIFTGTQAPVEVMRKSLLDSLHVSFNVK